MNRRLAAEISVLAGIFGFFLGGLVNFKKEIVDIMMAATVTGVGLAFLVFFVIYAVFYEQMKKESESWGTSYTSNTGNTQNKNTPKKQVGKKVDFVVDDDGDIRDSLYK